MMLIEVLTAVGMFAGATLLASWEYRKMRCARRCNQALRRSLCTTVAD